MTAEPESSAYNDVEITRPSMHTAFGVPLAGTRINWIELIRRPQVILRLIAWVFSVVVFACITQHGYTGNKCIINSGSKACSFSVAIGVFAFLTSLSMFSTDVVFQSISSIKQRRRIVILDAVTAGSWAFLWLFSFCQLIYHWSHTPPLNGIWSNQNGIQASITFCFLSIFVWALLCYVNVVRMKGNDNTSNYQLDRLDSSSMSTGEQQLPEQIIEGFTSTDANKDAAQDNHDIGGFVIDANSTNQATIRGYNDNEQAMSGRGYYKEIPSKVVKYNCDRPNTWQAIESNGLNKCCSDILQSSCDHFETLKEMQNQKKKGQNECDLVTGFDDGNKHYDICQKHILPYSYTMNDPHYQMDLIPGSDFPANELLLSAEENDQPSLKMEVNYNKKKSMSECKVVERDWSPLKKKMLKQGVCSNDVVLNIISEPTANMISI